MDRVRFGRALGYGARHAAKALVQAADAATTSTGKAPARAANVTPPTRVSTSGRQAPGAARPKVRNVVGAAKSASRSFLLPVKRHSQTVLLQIVGTFFTVFALVMGQSAYRLRAGMHQAWRSGQAPYFWLTVGLFVLFAWFALSSFLRARRLERG